VHGSGFLAAFCAGLTIAALDVELCDCFLEYGQTTAEMTLLFTFILFGSSLIWKGLLAINVATLLFAAAVVLIRPVAFFLSLSRTRLDRRSRLLIAWFGPRGLSSLLLILVPVFEKTPGSEQLFVVCCLIVLLSVALHGGSLMFLGRTAPPESAVAMQITAAAPVPVDHPPASASEPADADRITIEELRALQASGAPVLIVDVRADTSFNSSPLQAQGVMRIPVDEVVRRLTALNMPRSTWIALFCG
jgi:sodium/hydrogen antiporter